MCACCPRQGMHALVLACLVVLAAVGSTPPSPGGLLMCAGRGTCSAGSYDARMERHGYAWAVSAVSDLSFAVHARRHLPITDAHDQVAEDLAPTPHHSFALRFPAPRLHLLRSYSSAHLFLSFVAAASPRDATSRAIHCDRRRRIPGSHAHEYFARVAQT